jgi:hypothetical protein
MLGDVIVSSYRHTLSCSNSNAWSILEAILHVLYKEKGYFLHTITLLNVAFPSDARCAEHALAILAGSYTRFGGLNGVLGRDKGIEPQAFNLEKPMTQPNAIHALYKQGVFPGNYAAQRETLDL